VEKKKADVLPCAKGKRRKKKNARKKTNRFVSYSKRRERKERPNISFGEKKKLGEGKRALYQDFLRRKQGGEKEKTVFAFQKKGGRGRGMVEKYLRGN